MRADPVGAVDLERVSVTSASHITRLSACPTLGPVLVPRTGPAQAGSCHECDMTSHNNEHHTTLLARPRIFVPQLLGPLTISFGFRRKRGL